MKNVKTMSKLMIFALILGIHAIYSTDSFASIKGNIIGSENIVDVADAITSLRICSGINLNPNDNSDLNEENMIGLEEAIFALQVASGIKEQAVFGQLQQLLDDSVKNSKVPGAVLQIRTPSVQWVGAAGLSSVRNQIPMKTSDLLRIASMTKVFVSTVVLSLHEKGKLNIESSIQTYLSKEIVEKLSYQDQDIKIINLLNMTSGILDYVAIDAYNDDVEENPNRQTSWMPEELLEYVFNIYSDKYSADYEYFVSQGDIFEPGSEELIFVLLTNCEDESIFDSLFNSSLNLLYQ
jgi:phosphotransferase system IIB component